MSLLTMKTFEEKVKKLYYKCENVELVSNILNLPKDFVIRALTNQYSVFCINNNKFIAISDTHLGSPKQNMKFIDYVYNYAIKNKIHYIVHAGDFIEGKSNYTLLTSDADIQIKEAMQKYPRDNSISNYLLFGNHDYNTFIYDHCISVFESELNNRPDITTIGIGKSHLSWCNKVGISVNHDIKNNIISIPDINCELNLHGHHHKYQLSNNDLFLPTLSSDIKYGSKPGFTVLELNDDQIQINNIGFLGDQLIYYPSETIKLFKNYKVLTK